MRGIQQYSNLEFEFSHQTLASGFLQYEEPGIGIPDLFLLWL